MRSGSWIEPLVGRTGALLRVRGYSARTQDTYCTWVRRFLEHGDAGSADVVGPAHVASFLRDLTERARLAPRTRNQASSTLAFFLREVLGRDEFERMPRAKQPRKVPVVLSHRQASRVLRELGGKYRLIAAIMYGCGLRLSEAHQLRVKDVDFELAQISVRDGKGGRDRWVMLPDRLSSALKRQVQRVKTIHAADRKRGGGWVSLPHALARKDPNASCELGWQFLFPSSQWSEDAVTGRLGRFHLHPSATQRAVKKAARATGIPKPISCHTFRRSFATQMLRAGYDVRTVQKLMGHRDIRTTMIYVEAVTDAGIGVRSPLDHADWRD